MHALPPSFAFFFLKSPVPFGLTLFLAQPRTHSLFVARLSRTLTSKIFLVTSTWSLVSISRSFSSRRRSPYTRWVSCSQQRRSSMGAFTVSPVQKRRPWGRSLSYKSVVAVHKLQFYSCSVLPLWDARWKSNDTVSNWPATPNKNNICYSDSDIENHRTQDILH